MYIVLAVVTNEEDIEMNKLLIAVSFLLASAGMSHATSIDADGVRKCLATGQVTMVLPEKVSGISSQCRQFVFAPQPQSWWSKEEAKGLLPKMPLPYGGDSMRAAALNCSETHGKNVADATFRQMPTTCRLHYFPEIGTDSLTVKIPAAEKGGLY